MSKKQAVAAPLARPKAAGVSKWLLLFTVSITGGVVMILELLGTRIIAPYYGASLYVWSALISVTMFALALGYYAGGWLSDRFPRLRLPHILLAAALSAVLIPFFSGPVMEFCNPAGLRLGAFASAFILFTPALTALAMVGPFTIKLATEDLQGVGTVAGSVYAISTLGSVLATLLLSFYLLPAFGARAIIFSASLILLALAGFLMFRDNQGFVKPASILPMLLTGALIGALAINGFALARPQAAEFKVIHAEESNYGWVRVVDNQKYGARLLLSDASVLSAQALNNGRTLLNYQNVIAQLPLFRPDAKQALLIGLGGGHIALGFNAAGLTTDTIEIDPAIAQAALDYFNFKPNGEFLVGDARYEIKKLHKQYDFIIHDCFTGGTEPTHLLTVEMLTQLRGMLSEQGVLALNYVGFTQGEGTQAVASVYRTLRHVMPEVRVFITDKAEFTDFIFLASRQPINLDPRQPDPRVNWLLDHEYHLDETQGILITDNYNPLESMQVRKSEHYRQVFMQRISPELLIL